MSRLEALTNPPPTLAEVRTQVSAGALAHEVLASSEASPTVDAVVATISSHAHGGATAAAPLVSPLQADAMTPSGPRLDVDQSLFPCDAAPSEDERVPSTEGITEKSSASQGEKGGSNPDDDDVINPRSCSDQVDDRGPSRVTSLDKRSRTPHRAKTGEGAMEVEARGDVPSINDSEEIRK
jgi:hypothetical protein